jgi:methyl-accepting chemotaxis protein
MLVDVRSLGDEVTSAVDRITSAASALRTGADQGTRAVSVTEAAVAAMQRSVDESARRLTDLATTADASSRDTETIERTNAATGETVLTLRGEVDRHGRSLTVIAERTKALSRDARAVGEASDAARAAANRMQRTSQECTQRASEAARLADGAMRESQVGGKAIEDAVARIQEIATHAGTMEGSLRGLTERVQGMNPVLGAIADVTSRTSLLALNAGIIAAQAGERGAAFQVVVDELKALASRTAQLTSTVEESVRTVLEQRGKTDEAAQALRRVVASSIEDAHRAGAALDAIRASTTQSQQVSASIATTLSGQERDVKETLERIDVVDNAGSSVEATARALADEVRVLKEVAERVTAVSEDVGRASREQGELAARVGQVLALVSRQVRELTATQAAQHTDVARVDRSISEIRRFADDARAGAGQLETVTERMRQKVTGLTDALHRFRTRA